MEKVKLYKEQAEELELQKKELPIHGIVTRRMLSSRNNKAFESIDLDTLIRALYIGYEVEETFEAGDCVVLNDGKIVEIIAEESSTVVVAWIINGQMYRDQINKSLIKRHATKQERWWAKHGREVWELRRNDLASDKDGCSYTINLIKKDYVEFVEFGMRKKVKEIKESFKVICFAEDRKDVK